jgi:hypothetical protein
MGVGLKGPTFFDKAHKLKRTVTREFSALCLAKTGFHLLYLSGVFVSSTVLTVRYTKLGPDNLRKKNSRKNYIMPGCLLRHEMK